MVNAHAEISDASHPAHSIIVGQKEWMLALFTGLAGGVAPDQADHLGRTLMLLHEGALVAHGLNIFPDPVSHAREPTQMLLTVAGKSAGRC